MKKYFFSFLAAFCIAAVGISATNNSIYFKSSTSQILKDTVPSMQNGSNGRTDNSDTAGGTLDATGNTGINESMSTDTSGTGSTHANKKYSHSKSSNKKNSTGSKDSSSSSTNPPR